MPSKKDSTKMIILESLIPKLYRGVRVGSVQFGERDCEALILILSQSVDIEPLISAFHSLISQTIIQFKPPLFPGEEPDEIKKTSDLEKVPTFDDLDSDGRSQYQKILYMLYDFTRLDVPLSLTKSDCNLLRSVLGNPQNVDYLEYEKARG